MQREDYVKLTLSEKKKKKEIFNEDVQLEIRDSSYRN